LRSGAALHAREAEVEVVWRRAKKPPLEVSGGLN
jgi:hypothetical protein